MNFSLFLLAVFDGIAYAALVFMVALGLTLIFGVLRILNVAHGSLYAIGAYVTASVGAAIFAAGFAPFLAFPLMLIAAALIGVVLGGPIEYLLLRRIYHRPEVLQLLVTFAVFMIMEDVQRQIWGTQPYFEATALQLLGNVQVLGVYYTVYQLIFLPLVALTVLITCGFFSPGAGGKLIMAVTEDRRPPGPSASMRSRLLPDLRSRRGAGRSGGALASPTTSVLPGIGADMIVLSLRS